MHAFDPVVDAGGVRRLEHHEGGTDTGGVLGTERPEIVDRSEEYLGTCDRVIYRARKLLLEAVKRHRDSGELAFADEAIDYAGIRAVSFAYPRGTDWREVDALELQEAAE